MSPTLSLDNRPRPLFVAGSRHRRRLRRRRLIAATALVLTTAAAVGGVTWRRAVTADALVLRGAATTVVRDGQPSAGVITLRNALGSEAKVSHLAGGTFSTEMTLHNRGRHDVRIAAFPPTTYEFADCGPLDRFADGFHTIRSLPVTYRLFGVSRTVDVPFHDAAITSQTLAGDCAHPVAMVG